ncbi:multiple epidermal growth factor-like domains protein 11 [Trichonephila clavipes]|nr:multiple epidermal growth factor-like domains protein 11 [Trichonephila clavipes]
MAQLSRLTQSYETEGTQIESFSSFISNSNKETYFSDVMKCALKEPGACTAKRRVLAKMKRLVCLILDNVFALQSFLDVYPLGWKGGNCELPCSSDYYGQECKQKCECENGAACNPVDGSCTCTPGYKGKK